MREVSNVEQLVRLKPDYMGFIFHEKSPRFIENPIVINTVPKFILKTAVFVDLPAERVEELIGQYGFDAIQLHGTESPDFCSFFKGKVQVLKAFGVDNNFNFQQLDAYSNSVDYFLFDTKTPAYGGSGVTFDWNVLEKYTLNVPFFLSGGISLDNLDKIKHIKHPHLYGVDLNSRFETEPGLKDIDQLKKAFQLLR